MARQVKNVSAKDYAMWLRQFVEGPKTVKELEFSAHFAYKCVQKGYVLVEQVKIEGKRGRKSRVFTITPKGKGVYNLFKGKLAAPSAPEATATTVSADVSVDSTANAI